MSTAIQAEVVMARVRELPSLPKAIHEITLALNDENLCLESFTRKVAIDPALVTRILRAANSPFYGMSGTIGSVQDAVRLIGLRTVGAMLTTAAIVHSIAPPSCNGFRFREFWDHSLATAICSQELARGCGASPSVAFTAGLLHDIGQLALATYYPRELGAALAYCQDDDCPMYEAERRMLGITHSEVGAWIATHWHFSDDVVAAIRQHHDPLAAGAPKADLADIVHCADGIVCALDIGGVENCIVPPLQPAAWERLQLSPDVYLQLFERVEAGFHGLRDALVD
jgi:putative nucleotidyltransferase with HDIG domain